MSYRKLLKENSSSDVVSKYKNKFSFDVMAYIVKHFPVNEQLWIAKNLEAGSQVADVRNLNLLISSFKRLQKHLSVQDLENYPSIESLDKAVKNFRDSMIADLTSKENEDVLINNSNVLLVRPYNFQRVCYYVPNSSFCASSTKKNYINDGDLIVFILYIKSTKKTYVFEISSSDFKITDENYSTQKENFIEGAELYIDLIYYYLSKFSNDFKDKFKLMELNQLDKKWRQEESLRLMREKARKDRNDADLRRYNDEWKLDDDCPYVGILANALFDYLVDESELTVAPREIETRKKELQKRINELTIQYDNSTEVDTNIYSQITDLEDELSEINDQYADVYNLIPLENEYYGLQTFSVIGLSDEYSVGDSSDMDDAIRRYWEDIIDSEGLSFFTRETLENAIDENQIVLWFQDTISDDVYQDPESYLEDSDRELSEYQIAKMKRIELMIEKAYERIAILEDLEKDISDSEQSEKLNEKIDTYTKYIEDLSEIIKEIEDEPQGDFPDSLIDEVIESRMRDVENDPLRHLYEWDLELEYFVDKDELVSQLIEGGYESMSNHDGLVGESKVMKEWYYIIRV